MKAGLVAAVIGGAVVGGIELALARTENEFFQFCTTKAYGWPAPWKIDYCECEGSRTTRPTVSKIANIGAVAGSSSAFFAIFGGIALLRQHRGTTEDATRGR